MDRPNRPRSIAVGLAAIGFALTVMVTATLPPYAQPGIRIDTNVAAIGDATNLQGGLLLMTPLKAGDGQVFALYVIAVAVAVFVQRKNVAKAIESLNGVSDDAPLPAAYIAAGKRLQMVGGMLGLMIVVIAFLMTYKPGG